MHANANARKLTAAIDAWAISACKRDCILSVRSKTFRMYYNIKTKKHFKNEQRSRDAAAKKELIQVE